MDLFQRTVDNQEGSNETHELIVALASWQLSGHAMGILLSRRKFCGGWTVSGSADCLPEGRFTDATPEKALVLGRIAMAMYINSKFEFSFKSGQL